MQINNSVKVKEGVFDSDFPEINISGWCGRIIEINAPEGLITVKWDSQTLLNMPTEVIMKFWDYEFTIMTLDKADFEPCEARDTLQEAEDAQEYITDWANFLSIFEDTAPIYAEMFADADLNDTMEMCGIWYNKIEEAFEKPVKATLIESGYGNLREGSALTIIGFDDDIDDKYGILAICKTKHGSATIPLCDCEPVAETFNEAETLIYDYGMWFVNK